MKIVDANVLLYATNSDSPHNAAARRWLDKALNGTEVVGFCWVVILAYLRLVTNPRVFPSPLCVEEAVADIENWLSSDMAVVVEPTTRHLDILAGLVVEAGTAGNLVTDGHIAALAVEHHAQIVTFDADFKRFNGVTSLKPQ